MNGMLAPEVLVLGASGRVGSGVVAALLEAGSPVLAVARDAARLQRLAAMHADEPGLEVMVASVADDGAAQDLARRIARRPRPLRAVVDATAGVRRASRLLDQAVPVLSASLEQEVLPHLAAARHLLPLLQQRGGDRYLVAGGPHARCGWAGYGHASVAIAATRMLVQVLHEEAQPLGVRVQMLSIDAPVWTAENTARACPGWHSALGVGRAMVSLLARSSPDARCIVTYADNAGAMPPGLLGREFASVLAAASGAPGASDAGRAA
ncbi:SDR family oxidoreductase [Pseudoxanthomonas sp. SGD-10]|uniref:SDR family NAD(P)-dependent oxidoreductase n=1 Tax=Pseudoxanthomonas sp. GW2 TaxID=1211114 RepID=UPI0002F8801F|nr:SDR family oxidoreductase [Pseudoxanthomonas sp. GW2]RRN80018.1 SDR family oxidoreductase [Pseudoxanthomonas sp. SGD-10]